MIFHAKVYRHADDAEPAATGTAIDRIDIAKSTFEKVETASVGRALAFLNFKTKKGLASREEMEKMKAANPEFFKSNETYGSPKASPSQVGAIKTLAIKTKRDPNAYDFENMSKIDASRIIKELQEIADSLRA